MNRLLLHRVVPRCVSGVRIEQRARHCGALNSNFKALREAVVPKCESSASKLAVAGIFIGFLLLKTKTEAAGATRAAPTNAAENTAAENTAAAGSFLLTGLHAEHMCARFMAEYKRCDERDKVNGRSVYEGLHAGGKGTIYCWYCNEYGDWRFSGSATDIGTSRCELYVVDQAFSAEDIEGQSRWMSVPASGGMLKVVRGLKVQAQRPSGSAAGASV